MARHETTLCIGYLLELPSGEVSRPVPVMGGDFIIRQNDEVAFARTQSGQFDRPEFVELLECLQKL